MRLAQDDQQKKDEPQKKADSQKKPEDPIESDETRPLKKFMRKKLDASSSVLEGLCTEDLQLVADGAEILMAMSREEQWRVSNDGMYRRYSREFINAVEELQKEAEDNDMNGTSLAWVNVTMKCLKCHEWVRTAVLAEQDK